MTRAPILLAGVMLLSACGMPKTPIYEPNKKIGMTFCSELAQTAQTTSTQEMGVGVFLLVLGGASITASGVMSTINAKASSEHQELLGYVGAGLAVAPLIGVPFGMVLLSRSDEASALSAAANTAVALAESDELAYRDCALAKAAWVGSRTDATALARKALEDEKDKAEEREKKEKKDKEKEEAQKEPEPEPEPPPDDDEPPKDDD